MATKIESLDDLDVPSEARGAIEEALVKGPVWVYSNGEIFVAFTRPPKEYYHRFVDKLADSKSGTVLMFSELAQKAAVFPKGRALVDMFEEYPLLPTVLGEELTSIARGDGPKAALRVGSSAREKTL